MRQSPTPDLIELRLTPDARWQAHGLDMEWFEQKGEWLRRENGAPGCVSNFFDSAGRLFRLCGYDYNLLGPMFFHAVIGLEAMLRIHYKVEGDTVFKHLLVRAIGEGVVKEETFTDVGPLPDCFLEKLVSEEALQESRRRSGVLLKEVTKNYPGYVDQFAALIVRLRNDYFHGSHLMAPDLIHLAIQVREAADAVAAEGTDR